MRKKLLIVIIFGYFKLIKKKKVILKLKKINKEKRGYIDETGHFVVDVSFFFFTIILFILTFALDFICSRCLSIRIGKLPSFLLLKCSLAQFCFSSTSSSLMFQPSKNLNKFLIYLGKRNKKKVSSPCHLSMGRAIYLKESKNNVNFIISNINNVKIIEYSTQIYICICIYIYIFFLFILFVKKIQRMQRY